MSEPRRAENDPRLDALLRWRKELIGSGAVSAAAFKEAHVRLVLRSGQRDVDQIRAMLPAAVAGYADQVVKMLAEMTPVPQDGRCPSGAEPAPPHRGLPVPSAGPAPRTGFAPYQFGPGRPDVRPEVRPLSLRRRADGPGLVVSWPPYLDHPESAGQQDGSWVIYRLVCTEGQRGHSPDSGYLVDSTTATEARDDRALVGAVRHLQVWVNVGVSEADALAVQPFLYAAGVVVAAAQDVEIREDYGQVVGQWTVLPGVRAVHIHRIPDEPAQRDGPQFRIVAHQENLSGFVDDAVQRGRRYVYRLRSEVDVDGVARLSDAVDVEVKVSAVPEPVTDISVTTHWAGVDATFDVQWSPPALGRVLVFRTQLPPSADAASMELDASVLEQAGLSRDLQLTHPVSELVDGRGVRKSVMAAVPWPTEWTRAYFTPVTVVDGRARLGGAVSSVRTGVIAEAQITEYCNKQVLTFGWPAGAAAVLVYLAPKGYDPAGGLTGRYYEIALAEYEKSGGAQFSGELPGQGCSLHLVPVAYASGHRVRGSVASVEYAGLLRLWYDVKVTQDRRRQPLTASVRVRAEGEVKGSPPFVLVHNPDRIPLSVRDGRAIDMTRMGANGKPAGEPVQEFQVALTTTGADEAWNGNVHGKHGWIRLFAHLPPQRLRSLALLDPPVADLRLTPGNEPR